jgi:hypothetical protein
MPASGLGNALEKKEGEKKKRKKKEKRQKRGAREKTKRERPSARDCARIDFQIPRNRSEIGRA